MSKFSVSALLCAGLAVGFSAQASASVVYDLTLTANDGLTQYSGTGTLTFTTAPATSGLSAPVSVPATFTIFDTADNNGSDESFSGTASSVEFLNGQFYNASFGEQIGTTPMRFTLDTTGTYTFYFGDGFKDVSGTISAVLAPAATPLPAALPLFAGGLGFVGFLARRKKRNAAIA